jgi:hypothetical protein
MKTIVYRCGVVTFRIPAHWREEYSDIDGGTFYEDHPNSGTLRLKMTVLSAPQGAPTVSAMEMLQVLADQLMNDSVECATRWRKDGNAVLRYEESGFERGRSLTIFYWVVSNPIPPRHVRVANFSYTILSELRRIPQIQHDLKLLEAVIEAATFWPELGA